MRVIGRCTSYDPLNTSRITSAAGTIERTIMATATATTKTMVMDTTTINTTTISETLSFGLIAGGLLRVRLDGLRTRRRLQFGIRRGAITAHAF